MIIGVHNHPAILRAILSAYALHSDGAIDAHLTAPNAHTPPDA
jgi:hypothetical protein